MEITEYRVVTNEYSGALSNAVNQAIALGFQPYGALIVLPQTGLTIDGSAFYFAQPMVKYKDNKIEVPKDAGALEGVN